MLSYEINGVKIGLSVGDTFNIGQEWFRREDIPVLIEVLKALKETEEK